MNLEKIKNLIKNNGDKFILVENDVPEIVMLSFKEYEKLTEGSGPFRKQISVAENKYNSIPEETEFVIPLGPPETDTSESAGRHLAKPVRLEDIGLEDLPL